MAENETVVFRIDGDVGVITLPGSEFVLEQAQRMADIIFSQHEGKLSKYVLDLGSVSYINSSGISMIIRMNLEKKVRLVNVSRSVRDILDLTGILPFISEHTDVEEALTGFKG